MYNNLHTFMLECRSLVSETTHYLTINKYMYAQETIPEMNTIKKLYTEFLHISIFWL